MNNYTSAPRRGRGVYCYMFNVYKNQLSRQTGSRNLTGPKKLPTIWYTYMTLVTKYQISAINSYWEKCGQKYLGRQWNNSQRVDMSRHSDTLFRYRANQSLLLLLNARCLAEKQQDISCLGGVFFANTPHNMIYLFNYTEYYLEHWLNK
jgi:hypothetical protein